MPDLGLARPAIPVMVSSAPGRKASWRAARTSGSDDHLHVVKPHRANPQRRISPPTGLDPDHPSQFRNQSAGLGVGRPAVMAGAVLANRHLGVVATLPVQPQKNPIPLHGRDDLHQHRPNDALTAFRAGSLMRPGALKIDAQREILLALIGDYHG